MAPMTPATQSSTRTGMTTPRLITWALIGVAALMVVADLIQATALATGRVLVSAGGANPRLSLDGIPHLFTSEARAGTVEALSDTALSSRALLTVPSLLHAAVVVATTVLVLQIVRAVAANEPFSAPTLRRWRRLALVLLIGGTAQVIADSVANTHLITTIESYYGGDRSTPAEQAMMLGGDFAPVGANILVIAAGLVALALTAAFRSGARLAKDVDGLV